MSTFYEDASLHAIGAIRMKEWWQKSGYSQHEARTGCALTFWASLSGVGGLDRAPSITLPDGIQAGLRSLPLAEFEHVYIMTYGQKFDNLPSFMTVLDANRVLKEEDFLRALSSGKACTGFIAVLAEWMKQVAALQLPEVQQYPFVTTFDCDSLWRSRAVPPATCCGHAAGTLKQNKRSRANVDMPKRMQKLTYMYCRKPRDFLKISTPWRWPTKSPALESFVIRIMPMVGFCGTWRGGNEFDTIMQVAWDTYVVWGLRAAFNFPEVHNIVPYFSWGKPLQKGSAQNKDWGMDVIASAGKVVCVNQLWQTSRIREGPGARKKRSWKRGSLARIFPHAACRSRQPWPPCSLQRCP